MGQRTKTQVNGFSYWTALCCVQFGSLIKLIKTKQYKEVKETTELTSLGLSPTILTCHPDGFV